MSTPVETPQQYTQRILSHAKEQDGIKLQGATNKKLARLIKGRSTAKLRKRPAPDKWSIAEILAHLVERNRPELFTAPRAVSKRQKGRVYFDWVQNGKSKTIAAPYVLRAFAGAPVSTPLEWGEVQKGLQPGDFTIRNAMERFNRVGDLFGPVLNRPQRLEGALERLATVLAQAR